MILNETVGLEFLKSSISLDNEFQNLDTFYSWVKAKSRNNSFIVEEIPFDALENWYFENGTKNLKHSSGKFFSIEGISITTNFGLVHKWEQPIIIQPEIGILGIITKVFKGTRYFLMQAKMEPGNVNIIQISPTVQATRSNYTKVHKGNLPKYLEYFIDPTKSRIITDQLQTEQGGRFLKKRNRNMVVEVFENVPVDDDFMWLTLGQIKMLLRVDNLINMDSRSVLAIIPMVNEDLIASITSRREFFTLYDSIGNSNPFAKEIISSAINSENTFMSFDQVISWITGMKTKYELNVTKIPLRNVVDWCFNDYEIKHESKPFFSVIGVKVQTGNREVQQWTQPLLKEKNFGIIGYIVCSIKGILHFLVQAKVEPGSLDLLDLAPTVSCSNYLQVLKNDSKPPFLEFFETPKPESILFSTIQSEEGGRFFHFQNLNIIIKLGEEEITEIPENYAWLTLAQLMKLSKFGLLNIESRSLISAISLL
ncbi:MAG: NDP-hexose 2,3-dehydratase family protein [Bacteroidota bacterium]